MPQRAISEDIGTLDAPGRATEEAKWVAPRRGFEPPISTLTVWYVRPGYTTGTRAPIDSSRPLLV